MNGIKINPLVWGSPSENAVGWKRSAETSIGTYYAVADRDGSFWWWVDYGQQHDADTLDLAQAAAQADYDARILSALTLTAPSDKIAEAALLNAIRSLLKWDAERRYPLPYRVRDPIIAAIRALAGKGE